MEAREKAKDLFDKFYYLFPEKHRIDFGYKESKQCALIAVDELIKETDWSEINYWQEVKQEIEKL